MDKAIKQSIDARKDALKASFEIDAGMQKKIDELFAEIIFGERPDQTPLSDQIFQHSLLTCLSCPRVLDHAADCVTDKQTCAFYPPEPQIAVSAVTHLRALQLSSALPGIGDTV